MTKRRFNIIPFTEKDAHLFRKNGKSNSAQIDIFYYKKVQRPKSPFWLLTNTSTNVSIEVETEGDCIEIINRAIEYLEYQNECSLSLYREQIEEILK
jgi:hypothetical protein